MNTSSKQEFIQGRWFKINKKIKKRIIARYDKIKDWVMDPKGYFLIDVDKEKNLLKVGYCKITKQGNSSINDMVAEINGKTAIEILNTLINEKYISPHWAERLAAVIALICLLILHQKKLLEVHHC